MEQLLEQIGQPSYLGVPTIALRLLLATLLGAVVGFEREWQRHSAGLRTHVLVAVAAASFALLGIEIVHSDQFAAESTRLDPIRLIEAVTAGVAFLAAGTIIFSRGKVKGLTTGAGMWLAGAIGLASGLGFWQIAGLATLLALVVLMVLHRIEKSFVDHREGGRGDAS
ncbi:MAG: MgtC/SapB family protein [Rhizobiaceae bacterium]|nr:MgtC/SapB family protein [Rhizobiaceae bacterium]